MHLLWRNSVQLNSTSSELHIVKIQFNLQKIIFDQFNRIVFL
uniref:Uncharacterized protein n=1 Tax=Rhizophora mucronata TaxID=61149 RepID=A0A2P2QT73_RHIMU